VLTKLLRLIVIVPLAILVVVLSVANRQTVPVALNPFQPDDPVLAFSAPLFVIVFSALIAGIILGSFATWLSQGKFRSQARAQSNEAVKWAREAEKQKNRAEQVVAQALVPVSSQ
jgi:uncharacterized integral membrane protein